MTNPLVSIIVPVYNVQNSVARCLESICAQTWKDIEIIVLNDGSKDDSLSICQQFREKDPRIVVIDKQNEGLSLTRNAGMRVAHGKYVQFVDSDDLLEPDFTENMVRAAESANADLVISPYLMAIPAEAVRTRDKTKLTAEARLILSDASVTEKNGYKVREYGFLPAGVYDQRSYAMRLIERPATFYYNVVWNKLYRMQLLQAVDLWFTNDLLYAEDQQFNVRYLQYAKTIAAIDVPGYYYVQNPQGICHTQITASSVMQNKLQMLRYYKELFTKLGVYDEVQPQLYKSLIAFSENTSASTLLQRAIDDAALYWGSLASSPEYEKLSQSALAEKLEQPLPKKAAKEKKAVPKKPRKKKPVPKPD